MQKPLSYIEISRENLIRNFKVLKSIAPNKKYACVIKANAYGHGQNIVAKILEPFTDYFQVDDIEELRALRSISKKPTFVFGYIQETDLEEAVLLKGIIALYDEKRLNVLEQIGKKKKIIIPVHIKIDSFLGRQGLLLESVPKFIAALKKCSHIHIDGIYTHFADIEDTSRSTHALKQIAGFETAIDYFKKSGYKDFETHISATSGLLTFDPELPTTIVRLGIGLYGLWPSELLKKNWEKKITLRPVLRWVSKCAQVKSVPKGFSVGYGCTYITKHPSTIAIIPQGYSDGYDRGLSNCGKVLIHGMHAPIIGRVAMNMIVADVTHIKNVRAEDEVILLGDQKKEQISAEEIAEKINTINYEITTRITPLLPRIVK